jgi:hypothetical protein
LGHPAHNNLLENFDFQVLIPDLGNQIKERNLQRGRSLRLWSFEIDRIQRRAFRIEAEL